jgi:hypothetical protein
MHHSVNYRVLRTLQILFSLNGAYIMGSGDGAHATTVHRPGLVNFTDTLPLRLRIVQLSSERFVTRQRTVTPWSVKTGSRVSTKRVRTLCLLLAGAVSCAR